MDTFTAVAAIRDLEHLDRGRRVYLIRGVTLAVDDAVRDRMVCVARAENAAAADRRAAAYDRLLAERWTRVDSEGTSAPVIRVCPPEHGHGRNTTCYSSHSCRCEECRAAASAAKRRRLSTAAPTRTFAQPPRRDTSPDPLSADDSRHGTWTAYSRFSCRCEACRAAGSTYKRQRRAASSAGKKAPAIHGSISKYQRGCRCDKCREAMSDYGRRRREAKKAE